MPWAHLSRHLNVFSLLLPRVHEEAIMVLQGLEQTRRMRIQVVQSTSRCRYPQSSSVMHPNVAFIPSWALTMCDRVRKILIIQTELKPCPDSPMAALISASPVPEDPSLVDAVEKNCHTSIVCVSLSRWSWLRPKEQRFWVRGWKVTEELLSSVNH